MELVRRGNIKGIGILLIDIDKFKPFNDNYSHLIGDEVLVFVSDTIKKNVRTSDLVGRWGGEEIIVFFFDVDKAQAVNLAEKVRRRIEIDSEKKMEDVNRRTAVSLDKQRDHITVSMGLGVYPEDFTLSSDFKDIIDFIDKLLYKAKGAGRNNLKFITK